MNFAPWFVPWLDTTTLTASFGIFLIISMPSQFNLVLSRSPQEFRSLSYLASYVIHWIYQKSKNCWRWNSTRNKEIEALISSMRRSTEAYQYIFSLSRGEFWPRHSWAISTAEVSELLFKKQTNKDRITRLSRL